MALLQKCRGRVTRHSHLRNAAPSSDSYSPGISRALFCNVGLILCLSSNTLPLLKGTGKNKSTYIHPIIFSKKFLCYLTRVLELFMVDNFYVIINGTVIPKVSALFACSGLSTMPVRFTPIAFCCSNTEDW